MPTLAVSEPTHGARTARVGSAAYFALAALAAANLLSYLDRQIVSILAEAIKADLKLTDTDLGFLLGTAFAVFYAIVGIAMGGIADGLSRRKVMAFSLTLWSAMTALGGSATSFATLSIARFGVGIGEAAANPCAHSLICDLFPPRSRAVAMGYFHAGTLSGIILSMVLGGFFLQHWQGICPMVPLVSACGLKAWKAALFAVGLPGIPLAILVLLIPDPQREIQCLRSARDVVADEFAVAIPLISLFTVHRMGGHAAVRGNLVMGIAIAAAAIVMAKITGDLAQWIALGTGAFAVTTWGQIQRHRDKPLFALTLGDPTFVLGTLTSALVTCIGGSVGAWAAPYGIRNFAMPPTELGVLLGSIQLPAILAVVLGGWIADAWKSRDARAPMGMCLISLAGTIPALLLMTLSTHVGGFLAGYALVCFTCALSTGANAAMIQDLVLSRMRGAASAIYSLSAVFISIGTGPYLVGKISSLTGSLATGLLALLALVPVALVLMWNTAHRLPGETPRHRYERARAAGEPRHEGAGVCIGS